MSPFRRCASIAAKAVATARKKVVITNRAFDGTYSYLQNYVDIVENKSIDPWSRKELISHAGDAHAILAFMTDCCDEALLDACPNLELIACALKGFDNFDVDLCAERGVAVTAVPDLLTEPTAELAVLLALALGRRLREADKEVRSGAFVGWRPTLYGCGLSGSTVGIYGAGAVGMAVAERVKVFSPKRIIYVDPKTQQHAAFPEDIMERADSIADLLQTSDFLFLCTPLNSSSYHAINSSTIAQAKPGLKLVNISRGSCVDEKSVADALELGALGGYAADVFEFEDWMLADRPKEIEPRLLAHPKTIFSPHLGSAVMSTRQDIELAAADEIIRWIKGEPYLYKVN